MNLLAAAALLLGQVQVDQKSIDDAISKGVSFLKTAESHGHYQIPHCDELILYTFVVAGVPQADERFQKLLHRVLTDEPTHTYRVSLQAMLLEELDRANLFVVPLDEERQWWRYHHLFADLLRARLARERPTVLPGLHRAAAAWHEEHGLADDAIRHATAAGETRWATRLVEQHV